MPHDAASQLRPSPSSKSAPSAPDHLPSPAELRFGAPLPRRTSRHLQRTRKTLSRALSGHGPPIAIVGPCSIHCQNAALEYAKRLAALQSDLGERVTLLMRVYVEKPRTTVGWKGFLYDPDLDGSDDLAQGLRRTRKLMVDIAALGVPIATELLDPLMAPYLSDLLSWVAIGARTTESQIHRQAASGLPCPVGFKNGTDGSVDAAVNAMQSASSPHSSLGIDNHGRIAVTRSSGNPNTHLVLRGGRSGPNCAPEHVTRAVERARQVHPGRRVLVDCSHANCGKDHTKQPDVAASVMRQMAAGSPLLGIMVESHLEAGRQDLGPSLRYGQSITDPCLGFSETAELLRSL